MMPKPSFHQKFSFHQKWSLCLGTFLDLCHSLCRWFYDSLFYDSSLLWFIQARCKSMLNSSMFSNGLIKSRKATISCSLCVKALNSRLSRYFNVCSSKSFRLTFSARQAEHTLFHVANLAKSNPLKLEIDNSYFGCRTFQICGIHTHWLPGRRPTSPGA